MWGAVLKYRASPSVKMKRIVTVIAACLVSALIFGASVQAATQATTKEDREKVTGTITDRVVQNALGDNTKWNTENIDDIMNSDGENAAGSTGGSETGTNENQAENITAGKMENLEDAYEYTAQELRYMTCIIYCEARGESYAGQKAVGIVVMNRKNSDDFPDSIEDVIYQKGQFTPARNGSLTKAFAAYDKQNKNDKFKDEMKSCRKAAIEVLKGSTFIKAGGEEKDMGDYLFFSRYIKGAKYTLGHHQFK